MRRHLHIRSWLAVLLTLPAVAMPATSRDLGSEPSARTQWRELTTPPSLEGVRERFGRPGPLAAGMIPDLGETQEFDELLIYLEENATDGDLGIQFLLDGEAWKRIVIVSSDWRRMLDVRVQGRTKNVGLTEIFSESAEPSFDEVAREEFLALFPEGEFTFIGKTLENEFLLGTALLTHTMPDQPVLVSPEEDEEVDPDLPLVVEWETVPDPAPPASVIEAYHVVVEKDEDEERLRVLAVDMAPSDTRFTVPPEFLEPGKEYKVEILAIETSGNRIITEVPFVTED